MNIPCPAFGICGYSNAGKTTVILELVRQLHARGLTVGVIKHDTHGIQMDREGKDSDRIFKAGADVLIGDPTQLCLRTHRRAETSLHEIINRMAPCYDLILVEGHKTTNLPNKVWLSGEDNDDPPAEAMGISRILRRREDRPRILLEMIGEWLPAIWQAAPVYAGILFGGKSTRMGRPKHLLEIDGQTWLEHAVSCVRESVGKVVLLGAGALPDALTHLPILPDIDDRQGPLGGMLAAMRWAPFASWIFLPCDTPQLSPTAIHWLLQHRRPGTWAVLPLRNGKPEPLPALYERQSAASLERVNAPCELAGQPGVAMPRLPPDLQSAWMNVNTPDALLPNRINQQENEK